MASALILNLILIILFQRLTTVLSDGDKYHPRVKAASNGRVVLENPWLNTDWNALAEREIEKANQVAETLNKNTAKNVIMFLGDGMGLPTVAAARLYQAELRDQKKEDIYLAFEKFPHVGLSRTYNTDRSTPDSAGTATAFLCGVKANMGTIGVNEKVLYGDCTNIQNNTLRSIAKESIAAGKWVGVVTTTRITHATPAGAYAQTPDRDWEGYIMDNAINPQNCEDIASQLIKDQENKQIRVILGGGRSGFIPRNETDDELNLPGNRLDGQNLIRTWIEARNATGNRFKYVRNLGEFNAVDPTNTDYLLGLFNMSHMDYELDRIDRNPIREPSLMEMTQKAIKILERSPNGYFLLVEGGRIDQSHHDTRAKKALFDTIAFSDAIQNATQLTSPDDTLIVVTADHSHVFSFGGYGFFTQSVLDVTGDAWAEDDKPFLQLNYANGPGYYFHRRNNGTDIPRKNLTDVTIDIMDKQFMQDAGVPIGSETHGGEDVGIYARGPWSHLFHGNHEQNYIAHVMMYASCVGRYTGRCNMMSSPSPSQPPVGRSNFVTSNQFLLLAGLAFYILLKTLWCID